MPASGGGERRPRRVRIPTSAEDNETFTLTATHRGISVTCTATITDVPPNTPTPTPPTTTPPAPAPPGLSVTSPTVQEGADAEFTIRLTGGTAARNVSWTTRPGTASQSDSARDYNPPDADTILAKSLSPGDSLDGVG